MSKLSGGGELDVNVSSAFLNVGDGEAARGAPGEAITGAANGVSGLSARTVRSTRTICSVSRGGWTLILVRMRVQPRFNGSCAPSFTC